MTIEHAFPLQKRQELRKACRPVLIEAREIQVADALLRADEGKLIDLQRKTKSIIVRLPGAGVLKDCLMERDEVKPSDDLVNGTR